MPPVEETMAAMTNRSLRTIRTELEFLTDSAVITPQQLQNFLSQLPQQTILRAPVTTQTTGGTPVSLPAQQPPSQPPTAQFANTSLNEKQSTPTSYYAPQSPQPLPPPAYAAGPPSLATVSALYVYNPSDAGDLALQPNDRVEVTQYVNPEWWKGRNTRTGQEGIFPRNYVNVLDTKQPPPHLPGQAPVQSGPASYGNMPLEVAQGEPQPVQVQGAGHGKVGEYAGKFGKKLGNAAIFGAGATMGSDLVNSIF